MDGGVDERRRVAVIERISQERRQELPRFHHAARMARWQWANLGPGC
jgi:hypothetical protein